MAAYDRLGPVVGDRCRVVDRLGEYVGMKYQQELRRSTDAVWPLRVCDRRIFGPAKAEQDKKEQGQ